jgi:hypothetical protein
MAASGQFHDPAALPLEKKAGWIPESVWTLWRREKSYTAENRTQTVHLVARRYTDWAIPTPMVLLYFSNLSIVWYFKEHDISETFPSSDETVGGTYSVVYVKKCKRYGER